MAATAERFVSELERRDDGAGAALLLLATYALVLLIAWRMPGAPADGYVLQPDGRRAKYRLNGLRTLLATLVVFLYATNLRLLAPDLLFRHYGAAAAAACALGLAASLVLYLVGRGLRAEGLIDRRARCATVDSLAADGDGPAPIPRRRPAPTPAETAEFDGRSELAHFYAGLGPFNPQWGSLDVKMWLYVVGAVQLQLNVLSLLAAHVRGRAAEHATGGLGLGGSHSVGWGMAAFAGCLSFFVVEYMAMERVHLQTYDLFRERVGFKLVWGCLCFYPFFYAVGGLALASSPSSDVHPLVAAMCMLLFFAGWTLTRGANMQKAACKAGLEKFSWCCVSVSMATVPGSRGRVLCGGLWGVSRHVNYLGEIVQALALALPGVLATRSAVPLLYPLYYVLLFVPRQADDDVTCRAKYGDKVWDEYVRRVPFRIMPGVF